MVKNPPANAGDISNTDSIPGHGRFPGGGYGNPCQYSCLENANGQRSQGGYSPQGHKTCMYAHTLNKVHEHTMNTQQNLRRAIKKVLRGGT